MSRSRNDTELTAHIGTAANETEADVGDDVLQGIVEEIARINPINQQRPNTASKQLPTDLIEHIISFPHRLFQEHSAFVESRIDGHNITLRQFVLLSAIASLESSTQSALRDSIGMDRSTLSEVIKRLAANGLILQQQSREDRRAQTISLTDLGRKMLMDTLPIVSQANREFFGVLAEAEIEALAEIQSKLLGQAVPQQSENARSSRYIPSKEYAESSPPSDVRNNLERPIQEYSASLNRLQRARIAFDAELITQAEFASEKRRFLDAASDSP